MSPLPDAMGDRMYRIRAPYDGHDILGDPVSGDNVYITTYSEAPSVKELQDLPNAWRTGLTCHPHALKVGEKTLRAYALSGQRALYWVERDS